MGTECSLCATDGGEVVYHGQRLRVVRAQEDGFPAFYRVVWREHVAEFSDLSPGERALCMDAVVAVEQALREQLAPAKVNLAALGNMVPHLHWHVIARFDWDSHFPSPVWASAQRPADAGRISAIVAQRPALEADMTRRLDVLAA